MSRLPCRWLLLRDQCDHEVVWTVKRALEVICDVAAGNSSRMHGKEVLGSTDSKVRVKVDVF